MHIIVCVSVKHEGICFHVALNAKPTLTWCIAVGDVCECGSYWKVALIGKLNYVQFDHRSAAISLSITETKGISQCACNVLCCDRRICGISAA